MTAQQKRAERVVQAAIMWLRGKRPDGWSAAQHLAMPGVNAVGEHDAALGHAIADYLTMGGALKATYATAAKKRRGGSA